MGMGSPVSRGLPGSRKSGGHTSSSLISGLRASAQLQLVISRRVSVHNVFVVLILCATYLSMTSAQGNFTVQSSSYNCSSNSMICLGDAHRYTGNNSRIQVGRLSLTHEDQPSSLGIAYYNQQVRLRDSSTGQCASFNSSFTIDTVWGIYNGTNIRGDGMTFLISADSQSLDDEGDYFGFFNEEGITAFKSIVVEFDTYDNGYSPIYDINDNHVSFDFMNITTPAAANASDVNVSLVAEQTLYAWVEYSNETQQLEARVSNSNTRPVSPLLNYTVNLFDHVEDYMWVGFSSSTGDSYANFYIGNWTFESYGIQNGGKSGGNKLGLIVGISVGVPASLLACIIIVLFMRRRHRSRSQRGWSGSMIDEDPMMQFEGMPERFSYKQLSVATRAFSGESKLGQGGFGSVYRGVLPSSGIPVAVKKISSDSSQGGKEFMAEVSIISRLRHRNLIQLIGWCKDASKAKYLLVYELMPNGSLDKVLFGLAESQAASLSWPQRFNIVTGTAAGLEYLHQGWKQQVIHRDIKSSNIMLDKDWNAKLGDFGLARLVDHKREAATTLMAGTYGYIAPEVGASGKFTDKTDVFAFGAVVLEVACGRKALSNRVPEDEMILVDWVWCRLSEGDLMSTVDKRLGDYDAHWMEVLLIVGLWCSHPNPVARPSMRNVVQVLAGDVPVPSIPASKPAPVSSHQKSFSTDYSHISKSGTTSKSRSGSISLVSTSNSETTQESAVKSSGPSSNSNSSFQDHIPPR